MLMSHTTSNEDILGLVGKIRRFSFQWDWSHIELKPESTGIAKTIQVSRTCLGAATPYFGLWAVYHA
jgi:hypothetical protein